MPFVYNRIRDVYDSETDRTQTYTNRIRFIYDRIRLVNDSETNRNQSYTKRIRCVYDHIRFVYDPYTIVYDSITILKGIGSTRIPICLLYTSDAADDP